MFAYLRPEQTILGLILEEEDDDDDIYKHLCVNLHAIVLRLSLIHI